MWMKRKPVKQPFSNFYIIATPLALDILILTNRPVDIFTITKFWSIWISHMHFLFYIQIECVCFLNGLSAFGNVDTFSHKVT